MMNNVLILLTGLPGSGKTTTAKFFHENHIPVIRMGSLTDNYLKRYRLPENSENEEFVKLSLRQMYGEDIYARVIIGAVKREFFKNRIIVVEGVRNNEEYLLMQKYFNNVMTVVVSASKKIRFDRLKNRKIRSQTYIQSERRDIVEGKIIGMDKISIKTCEAIKNEGTFLELKEKVNKLIRELF